MEKSVALECTCFPSALLAILCTLMALMYVNYRIFLLTTTSWPALGPTQPPTQWYQGLFPRG